MKRSTRRHAAFILAMTCAGSLLGIPCRQSSIRAAEPGSLPTSRSNDASAPVIERRLPPVGIEIPADVANRLSAKTEELRNRLRQLGDMPDSADAEVFLKAVDYAVRHREFYDERELPRADTALASAEDRIEELAAGKSPWVRQRGLVVRGYRSRIDGSAQPYGLVIPDDVDFDRASPLYVWLHGRGDKQTDLHFIHERQTRAGTIQPGGAITLHPFGRHCVGFKSAGEVDVLEAINHVRSQYTIDDDRIVLMGFSMGGAGTWHVGAHYAERFVAISPGAGFAETARYQNLKPAEYPPWYEQRLWGAYDVPGYVRNLFSAPVIAYSGELDKQIQAARVMEEAYREQGRELTHIIGPGMGHKYHPDSLAQILSEIDTAVKKGRERRPAEVHLQTQTLRYGRLYWVEALGLDEHWRDSHIDARQESTYRVAVETKNVIRLSIDTVTGVTIAIDGESVTPSSDEIGLPQRVILQRVGGRWTLAGQSDLPVAATSTAPPFAFTSTVESAVDANGALHKRPGRQGPIDDAFLEPFLVVTPSGKSSHPAVQAWVDFELPHFVDRWRALFRGEVRMKRDVDVTPDDLKQFHLVAWGTPESNKLLAFLAKADSDLTSPIRWPKDRVSVGTESFDAAHHVPAFIYPLAESNRYLVINSGPTFRESHDRTNSLQNPKLPDWAVIDVRQSPDDASPGRIAAAGFFDERWQVKSDSP